MLSWPADPPRMASEASRLSKVKFLTTFETDLVRPALDRKHAAHLTVTAPKHQSEDPKKRVHASLFPVRTLRLGGACDYQNENVPDY
jgi:hypothetical protein